MEKIILTSNDAETAKGSLRRIGMALSTLYREPWNTLGEGVRRPFVTVSAQGYRPMCEARAHVRNGVFRKLNKELEKEGDHNRHYTRRMLVGASGDPILLPWDIYKFSHPVQGDICVFTGTISKDWDAAATLMNGSRFDPNGKGAYPWPIHCSLSLIGRQLGESIAPLLGAKKGEHVLDVSSYLDGCIEVEGQSKILEAVDAAVTGSDLPSYLKAYVAE